MPALIGYLVAIAVFIGGGYAGMQWLTAPDDAPSAVIAKQSGASAKSSTARLIASRKRHAAEAERLANAPQDESSQSSAQDQVAQSQIADVAPVQIGDDMPSAPKTAVTVALAHSSARTTEPTVDASAESPDMTSLIKAEIANEPVAVKQNEKLLAARAEIDRQAAVTPGNSDTLKAGETGVVPSRSAERKAVEDKSVKAVSKPERSASKEASDSGVTNPKKTTAVKRKAVVAQLAKASRKPVLMILRTIEFPDGRREQRLLPMAAARFGEASAFAVE